MSETPSSDRPAAPAASPLRPRGVAYAYVWTAQTEPVSPADIADELYGRGFVPGVTDPDASTAALSEAGLADARFTIGSGGFRFISLSSSRGNGCRVSITTATDADLPDDYIARRTVPHPKLLYTLEAGGPSNSDRNLCEHVAEILFLLTDGLVEIGGLGTKGNRPTLHNRTWLGKIKAMEG
jgi:hypothetical protein